MARTNSVNFTGANQFPIASAGTDIFKKEDVQVATKSLDLHDHSAGLGLPIAAGAIAAGSIDGSKLTDNTVTSAKILNGTIAAVDIASAGVANDNLGPDTARANLLTNGGFEIWQRGNGPFTTNASYTTDRWSLWIDAGDSITASRDTTNVDASSGFCVALTYTKSTGATHPHFQQYLGAADYPQLGGRVLSFSMRVRCSTPNAVRLAMSVDGGSTFLYSPYHSGNGTYQTLTFISGIVTNAMYMGVNFQASCTAYLDNAMLVVGSQPANYVPLHPADDLARCLRYYEILGVGSDLIVSGIATAGAQTVYQAWPYRAVKPVNPTLTLGTWSASNAGAVAMSALSNSVLRLSLASSAAGAFYSQNTQAVTLEANP